MFCWCYYAHITRIARSSPLGPVGLVPKSERGGERRESEAERERRERKEEGARKPAKKQLPGKMTASLGLFREGKK